MSPGVRGTGIDTIDADKAMNCHIPQRRLDGLDDLMGVLLLASDTFADMTDRC